MSRSDEVVVQDAFIEPGYAYLPAVPTRLSTVVASGVAVAMYDVRREVGGMNHYVFPKRRQDAPSTARFALPAIVALFNMLRDSGSRTEDIEVHMFGGASNSQSERHVPGLAEDNVRVGREILAKLKLTKIHADTGGARGRKVIFNTKTGETVVAIVERIRESDWYPECA